MKTIRHIITIIFILMFLGCSMFEKQNGEMVLKKAEVNIKDIQVKNITFDSILTFSDGGKFDISNPTLGIIKYVSDIKNKKFDFTIKNLIVEGILEIKNPAPLNFELHKVSIDFYLDQEKIFNVTDTLGIDIAKESTTESPIEGKLPLNSNFKKIMSAENIVMKGIATLKIKIAGTGFDYDHKFEHTYKIPKEEIQKKIDDTIAQYMKMAVDYINKNMPGGGSGKSGLPSAEELLNLFN